MLQKHVAVQEDRPLVGAVVPDHRGDGEAHHAPRGGELDGVTLAQAEAVVEILGDRAHPPVDEAVAQSGEVPLGEFVAHPLGQGIHLHRSHQDLPAAKLRSDRPVAFHGAHPGEGEDLVLQFARVEEVGAREVRRGAHEEVAGEDVVHPALDGEPRRSHVPPEAQYEGEREGHSHDGARAAARIPQKGVARERPGGGEKAPKWRGEGEEDASRDRADKKHEPHAAQK